MSAQSSVSAAFLIAFFAGDFLGCASASDGELQGSFAASPTGTLTQQAPAEEKSATPVQAASARPAATSPSQTAPAPPPAADDDDGEADLVESGVMSDPQRAIMQGVGRCFERALRKGPGPGGSLALAVTVDADGAVTELEMGPGYPASARPCVEARVKSVRFPKEPAGGIRYYRYPINEQPADDDDANE